MTHEEKLKSQPEDTTDHDRLDQLNRELADKLAQLRDAGVDVDRGPANLDDPADRDRVRALLLCAREGFQGNLVNTKDQTQPD